MKRVNARALDGLLRSTMPASIFAERLSTRLLQDQQFAEELAEHILRDPGFEQAAREHLCRETVEQLRRASSDGWQDRAGVLPALERVLCALSTGGFSLRAYTVPVPFVQGTSGFVRNVRAELSTQNGGGTWPPLLAPFVNAVDPEGAKFHNAPLISRDAALGFLQSLGVLTDQVGLLATLDLFGDERQHPGPLAEEPFRFKGNSVSGGIGVAAIAAALRNPVGRDLPGDTAVSLPIDSNGSALPVRGLDKKVAGILRENDRRQRNGLDTAPPINHLIVPKVDERAFDGVKVIGVDTLWEAVQKVCLDPFAALCRRGDSHLHSEFAEKLAAFMNDRNRAAFLKPVNLSAEETRRLVDSIKAWFVDQRLPRDASDLAFRRRPAPVVLEARTWRDQDTLPAWVQRSLGTAVSGLLSQTTFLHDALRNGSLLLIVHELGTPDEIRRFKVSALSQLETTYPKCRIVFVGDEAAYHAIRREPYPR